MILAIADLGGLLRRFSTKYIESRESDCWIWTAATDVSGYGQITSGRAEKFKQIKAHRASWILFVGPIPEGLDVLHSCDNPPCVNPGHLFLGTQLDNSCDMVRKGRCGTRTKLSWDDVLSIRASSDPMKVVAAEYGIHPTYVSILRCGRARKGTSFTS